MEHDETQPESSPVMQVDHDQFCVGCSYNLRGLPADGRCPECGALVERSLRGDLLEYSSPDYLNPLSRGLHIVVVCTIAQVALTILFAVVGIAVMAAYRGLPMAAFETLLNWANVAFMLLIVYGWYLFSTPDPAIVGSDKGDTPRRVVRIAAAASAALTVAAAVIQTLPTPTTNPNMPLAKEVVAGSASVLAALAGIVLYFASLLYVRWIAKRIPEQKLDADARKLMWLGPLLYILLGCVIIGPIIALILYLKLLLQTRRFIDVIRETQTPLYPD